MNKDTQDIIRLEKAFVRIIQKDEELTGQVKDFLSLMNDLNERLKKVEEICEKANEIFLWLSKDENPPETKVNSEPEVLLLSEEK